jgi:hypothetical protein
VVILGFFLTISSSRNWVTKIRILIIYRQIRPYSKVSTLYIALSVFFSDMVFI